MRNRRYETVFILQSDLEEGKKKEILDRLDGVVEKGAGIRVKREDWGVRRLAYPVNRQPKGHYYRLDFVGSAQVVAELERHMRMFENVFRFLTVKTEDQVDLEAAKKESVEEREKEDARQAALREEARQAALREAAAAQKASQEDEPVSSAVAAEGAESEEVWSPEADPQEKEEEEEGGEAGVAAEEKAEAEAEDEEERREG